jgi:glutamyl-tRNA synthetase
MENNQVRVRFAPSPTGGLHLGGVRTVLYNYLFAKQQAGTMVLRIEDTDQTRFVDGAEEYINACLNWCGLFPDESPTNPGSYAPYRQSERKPIYKQYALQLVNQGHAYYDGFSAQYDSRTRLKMRNSLTLTQSEVDSLIDSGVPYVIRIKMPEQATLVIDDMIRGEVTFDTNIVDDKVLLKADGMPTYHLAVVVDDYLMKITHAFRGEEWLPSAPVHLLLWEYLGWKNEMPKWAHLPLILKPDGNGKLSKRDGERLGFPVFAMDWTDPKTNESTKGFKEHGFLPEAFVNMLALLGWNPGTEQEVFSLTELIKIFSIDRVHKGGAKFDFEKAKWFNQQHIQLMDNAQLLEYLKPFIADKIQSFSADQVIQVIALVKERIQLLSEFWSQAFFFFENPTEIDLAAIQPKWNDQKTAFFKDLIEAFNTSANEWSASNLEAIFTDLAAVQQLKKGELMMPLRIMLVGGKFGPNVFDIAAFIGKASTIQRVENVLQQLSS